MIKKLVLFISSNYVKCRINQNFINGKYNHLFDEIKIYNENDLPDDVRQNIQNIIDKYGWKGYGFWKWKPYIILNELNKLNDNDILVHLDSHCTLDKIEDKLDEYFNLLQTLDKPLLTGYCFCANDLQYTSKPLINYVENTLNYKYSLEELKNKQIEAGVLFMRKNKFIVDLIKLWDKILNEGFEYVTDSYNDKSLNYEEFKENRHDQSVLSLLCKYYNISVFEDFDWETMH